MTRTNPGTMMRSKGTYVTNPSPTTYELVVQNPLSTSKRNPIHATMPVPASMHSHDSFDSTPKRVSVVSASGVSVVQITVGHSHSLDRS